MACDSFAVCFSSPSHEFSYFLLAFFFFPMALTSAGTMLGTHVWIFSLETWKMLLFQVAIFYRTKFWIYILKELEDMCVFVFILCYTILHYYFIILRFLTAFHPYTYSCLSTFAEETVKDSKERWNLYLKIYRLYS